MSFDKIMIFILAVFSWSGAATSTKCDDDEDCDVVVTESFKVGNSTICLKGKATYNGYCKIPFINGKRDGLKKGYCKNGIKASTAKYTKGILQGYVQCADGTKGDEQIQCKCND